MVITQAMLAEKLNKANSDVKNQYFAHRIVKDLFLIIHEQLAAGNEVMITNVGKLKPVTRKEKKGQSSASGKRETIVIPEHKTIKFTTSGILKERLRKLK